MTKYDQLDRKTSMHGLPKAHKQGTPLRPVLSMTVSSHHQPGKWLAGLLQLVLKRFSFHCLSDSITFAKTMQSLGIAPNVFMYSDTETSGLMSRLILSSRITRTTGSIQNIQLKKI